MIGIGLTRVSLIPPGELGPAMGPLPAAARPCLPGRPIGGLGIGFNRSVLPICGADPLPRPAVPPASMPTDVPAAARRPDDRGEAAAQVGAAEAASVGTVPRPFGLRFDVGDLFRVLGGLVQVVGRATGQAGLLVAGQAVQRVGVGVTARAAAQRTAAAQVFAQAVTIGGSATIQAREGQPLTAPAPRAAVERERTTLSRGEPGAVGSFTAEIQEGRIMGRVQTVAGERTFDVDAPFADVGFGE